jgi:hypothetical protein
MLSASLARGCRKGPMDSFRVSGFRGSVVRSRCAIVASVVPSARAMRYVVSTGRTSAPMNSVVFSANRTKGPYQGPAW